MDINGKVALITGSAKRIGRDIALELALRGARLAVHYRSSAREAQEVAGDTGAAFQAELTNANAIEKMFNQPFFVSQHAARLMRKSHAGKIINIVDVAGEVIWPGYLPYSVSKAALIAVNRGLAKAYAPNIQVNAIAPGPVLFPDYYTEEQKRSAIDRTLLKRAGSPRDIVNAVVFLIENDYITGDIIHVDGGRHIM